MIHEATPIELSTMPDLVRLAREVARDGKPRVLREAGADVAVLSPARPKRLRAVDKRPTQQQIDAALATFGTWKDLDADKFLRELDEARGDARPRVKL